MKKQFLYSVINQDGECVYQCFHYKIAKAAKILYEIDHEHLIFENGAGKAKIKRSQYY